MEKHFALIKNGLVEGVIVATTSFLSHIEKKYDLIIDVTDGKRPTAGDSYYYHAKTFICNTSEEHPIPVDRSAVHLQGGYENGFEPFQISKYSVSYENGTIVIGCKKYDALGMLDTLHKFFVEKKQATTYFAALDHGLTHGKFDISWEDAKKIYEALKTVKFQ